MAKNIVSRPPLAERDFQKETTNKATADAQTRLNANLDRLIRTMVKNAEAMKGQEDKFRDFLKQRFVASKEEFVGNIKKALMPENIARKVINPSEGGLVDAILKRMETKREERKMVAANKKEFVENYLTNTERGRAAAKRDPDKAAETAKQLFETKSILEKEIAKAQAEIERKNTLKEKTGFGGASDKEIASLKKMTDAQDRLISRFGGVVEKDVKDKEKAAKKDKEKDNDDITKEERIEAAKLNQEVLTMLKLIEENTRGSSERGSASLAAVIPKASGNLLTTLFSGGLFKTIGTALTSALSKIFSARAIFSVLSKVFVPAMIVGSIVNGIYDGFKEFQKSGSISEALMAGFGGILEFITFGLFDKGDLKTAIDAVVDSAKALYKMVEEYVITPVKEYVIQPLMRLFKYIGDSVSSLLDSVRIPKIKIFNPVGDDLEFGPWKPFGKNVEQKPGAIDKQTKQVNLQKPVNNSSDVVKQKTDEAAKKPEEKVSHTTQVVTSAPVSVQNKTSINTRAPVRVKPVYSL